VGNQDVAATVNVNNSGNLATANPRSCLTFGIAIVERRLRFPGSVDILTGVSPSTS
jgi:hypothetical protein